MRRNNNNNTKINTKNTPYLIIVESPSKCIKIEKFLGFQYKCIASNGHIREISKITEKTYEPIFEIIPLKKKHVENMREIISYFSPENIFLGTDDDREGEAIAWHICMTFELPIEKVHRILFHEITEQALKTAVKNPLKIRMNIVLAQHARQILDRLVGFQISPLLTKRMNSSEKQYLSAGRCQTPALRLIYDKVMQKSIGTSSFSKDKYQVTGIFFSQKSLKFNLSEKIETKEQCISFLEKSKYFNHELILENPNKKTKSAPIPFNTSSLLQYANIVLQLSTKETMSYCQQLYQNGYITYMRTESTKYSEMFLLKAKEFIIEKTNSLEYIGDLSKIQNINVDCPHEAIRVTNIYCSCISLDFEKESQKQKEQRQKLYYMIWKRSIQSCMSDYNYKEIVTKITTPIEDVYYQYIVDIPLFLGWYIIEEIKEDNLWKKMGEEQIQKNALLLFLQSAKSPIKYMKIECSIFISEKNRHYTEAGLIHDLEEYGIGRPSTFSIILQNIQDRHYVVKKNIEGEKIKCIDLVLEKEKEIRFIENERIIGMEKNKLVLQELGKLVIEELIPTFHELFSYDYTKKMEMELEKISQSKEKEEENKWNIICSECDKTIKNNTKQWKLEMKQKYRIDDEHELIFMKTGAVIVKTNNKDKTEEYKCVHKNMKFDFEKLRNKEYNLEELLEISNEYLGDYEEYPLYLKKGPYGFYVTWGEKKESLDLGDEIKIENITLEYIITYLQNKKTDLKNKKNKIVRVLNDRISICKGKYGNYIYYKNKDTTSSSPQFYNLKLFPNNYLNCDINEILQWLENTYGII